MMKRSHDILVDLDGTITDPAQGIVSAYRFALDRMGVVPPAPETLTWVIGPPLREAFPRLIGPQGDVERAVGLYREYYSARGLTEATLYDGIVPALDALRAIGPLHLCTAKPRVFAVRVLESFGLSDRFTSVYGPELDGRMDDKAELMAHLMLAQGGDPDRTVMIGDRDNDVRAARANGVRCVGCLWGYGGADELTRAGATLLCDRPDALPTAVGRLLGLG